MSQRRFVNFNNSDGWQFQAVTMNTGDDGRVMRVWFRLPGTDAWEFGHKHTLPASMDDDEALALCRRFIMREIDHDEYNAAFGVTL